jgi:ketosteroid isomerase-like protein
MTQTALDLTRQIYTLAGQGRWDEVEQLLSEDLVIHKPESLPYGGEWRGRDALRRLYTKVMTHWADPSVELRTIVGDEEHAVALLDFTMTSRATGDRFTMPVAEASRAEGGNIVEMRIHYFDTAGLLGRIEMPKAGL